MSAIDQLIAKARTIKAEQSDRANTAMRIGGWMEELLHYLQDALDGKANATSSALITQSKHLIGAVNEIAGLAGMSEEQHDYIIRRIEELSAQIEVIREYEKKNYFPEQGRKAIIYVDKETGATYRWTGNEYIVIGGYKAGKGIKIEGNTITNTHTFLSDAEIDSITI